MNRIKKIISTILALVTMISSLSGCVRKSEDNSVDGNSEYNRELLNVRLTSLWDTISEDKNLVIPEGKVTVFLSICNKMKRATVLHTSSDNLQDTWKDIEKEAYSLVENAPLLPLWVKADIVINRGTYKKSDVEAELSQTVDQGYRLGLSLDENLELAYLESECNANGIYDYSNDTISADSLCRYTGENYTLSDDLTLFVTQGYFCGTDNVTQKLIPGYENYGIRDAVVTKDSIKVLMNQATNFLVSLQNDDGSFSSGYFGHSGENIGSKSVIGQISALWAIIKNYEQSPNKEMAYCIDQGINHIIGEYILYDSNNAAYIYDPKQAEISLEACSRALSMLVDYQKILKTDRQTELMCALGNGLLAMNDSSTGDFTESLTKEFTVMEKSETSYHGDEAAFALSRLYQIIPDMRYINAARSVAEQFIVSEKTDWTSPWIFYTLNELTKQDNDPRYYEAALSCIPKTIEQIHRQTLPTCYTNELIGINYEIYQRALKQNINVPYINSSLDGDKFISVFEGSIKNSFSSFGFPESVMYFSNPAKLYGSFFIRDNNFRSGPEEIMHYIFGYSLYLNSISDQ